MNHVEMDCSGARRFRNRRLGISETWRRQVLEPLIGVDEGVVVMAKNVAARRVRHRTPKLLCQIDQLLVKLEEAYGTISRDSDSDQDLRVDSLLIDTREALKIAQASIEQAVRLKKT